MKPLPKDMTAKVLAASSLFRERGLDGTKTSDICAITGIPKATLYYYFEGKHEVFSFIFNILLTADEEAISTALEARGSGAERLSSVVRAYLDVYASNPIAFQATHLDLARAAGDGLTERVANTYLRPIKRLLEEGITDGSLPNVRDTRAVAAAILGAIRIAAEQSLLSDREEDIAHLHEILVNLILAGIGPQMNESIAKSPVRKR